MRQNMRRCSYCLRVKPVDEFSEEHIWPDALGGDALPSPWITRNVCVRCNNLAGQFVDGEFLRSWFGSHERASSARAFLDPADPRHVIVPPTFMGPFEHPELRAEEVAEFWLGPAGEHFIHIRPKHGEEWDTYAGGSPTGKKPGAGTAFLSFTSAEPYWVTAALLSFNVYFNQATRIFTNANVHGELNPPFEPVNERDENQARLLRIARSISDAGEVRTQPRLNVDVGARLLAKLALGLGREMLGEAFLDTTYAQVLQSAVWEKNPTKRAELPVRGTGFFSDQLNELPHMSYLSWSDGWTLATWRARDQLALIVATPCRRIMSVLISDEPELIRGLDDGFGMGQAFVIVPALKAAVGPMKLQDFLASQLGKPFVPDLKNLAAARCDPSKLPPKRRD